MASEGFFKVLFVNLKHNFRLHFLAAMFIVGFTPVVFGIAALNYRQAAQPIEMFLSLIGMILFAPIFLPEQAKEIRKILWMRKLDLIWVILLRLSYSLVATVFLMGGFVLFMRQLGSEVSVEHFAGGVITAMFLGALGFAAAGISQNVIAGYMVSFLYYTLNFAGRDKLGHFFLFSMSMGSFTEKYYLLTGSAVLILITLVVFHQRGV